MTGTDFHIPTLTTERLVLRAPKASDFETYSAFRQSERSRGTGGPYTRDQSYYQFCELIGHWVMFGFGRWIVADKDNDTPLGVVGLYGPEDWPEPEIAWVLFDGAEGKGYATEAAKASRAYAYDVLGWDTLVSCMMPDNAPAIALAERLGATHESVFEHPDLGALVVYRHPGPEALQ